MSEHESEAAQVLAETNPDAVKAVREQAQHADKATQKFKGQGDIPTLEGAESIRAFVAPQHPYGRILIRPGTMVSFPDRDSPTGQRDMRRDGDIYAVFKNGVCIADLRTEEGRAVAEWCDAHGPDKELHKRYHRSQGPDAAACKTKAGFCRDVTDQQVGLWSQFKLLQTATANRDPAVSPTQDIDSELTPGGKSGIKADGLAGQAVESGRRMVEASRED